MADFKTHIATSTAIGIAYGGVAYGWYDVPLPTSVLAAGLCGVSGMLPDLDSNSGRPLRESVAFAAAVVPMMLVDRMRQFDMPSEAIVLAGAGVYLLIRFGLGWLLKQFTVHRGMFHSIPAAVIFFEVAFLLASGPDVRLRWYKAGAVLIGFLTHLVLDELYSIEWYRGRWRFKKSFRTAVKFFGDSLFPNVLTYGLLALLSFVAFREPGWMEKVQDRYAEAQSTFWEHQRARLGAAQAKAPDHTATSAEGAATGPVRTDAGPLPAGAQAGAETTQFRFLYTADRDAQPPAGPDNANSGPPRTR